MEKISLSEISYRIHEKCLKITNGIIEVIVTLDMGPRIIKYGFVDGDNHFAENISDKIISSHGEYEIVGGHRFWHLPENKDRTYIPDEKSVAYEIIDGGARIIQDIEKWTQVQKVIDICLDLNSTKVSVTHRIISLNAFDINLSISGISCMKKGGIEVIPLEKRKDGLEPNKSLVFWPYSNIKDPRVYFGDKYIAMKVDENTRENFKIGVNTNLTYALYFNNNEIFVKEFKRDKNNNNYPDLGCCYESSISKEYVEMQTLSPIYRIGMNESIEHTEIWTLYKEVNLDFIDNFIDNYNEINTLLN